MCRSFVVQIPGQPNLMQSFQRFGTASTSISVAICLFPFPWSDLDVTMGRLQNQVYFQGVCCNTVDHYFHTTCGVAIHTVNFLKITLILQPARSDDNIVPAHAHENRLCVPRCCVAEMRTANSLYSSTICTECKMKDYKVKNNFKVTTIFSYSP